MLVSFCFSFVDFVIACFFFFMWLCFDVHVLHVVLLYIGHDSCYAVSSTHWVVPHHTLGPLVL